MTQTPDLPFHFRWRNGQETATLAAALVAVEADPAATAYHLAEGHLQQALVDQGYLVLAENLHGDSAVAVLRERLHIALELHRSWWAEGGDDDDLSRRMANLGRILRAKGEEVVTASKKRMTAFRSWLSDLIRPDGTT